MPEVQWYYARRDEQFGPISASELKQLADSGKLSPDDLLWREGMDAWTTAVNLHGLFAGESSGDFGNSTAAAVAGEAPTSQPVPARPRTVDDPSPTMSLPYVLRMTQGFLWGVCVLVVLAGLGLLTRAFLNAKAPAEEAAAAAVYSTFFIAAYVLARSGEKLSRLLLRIARRRRSR